MHHAVPWISGFGFGHWIISAYLNIGVVIMRPRELHDKDASFVPCRVLDPAKMQSCRRDRRNSTLYILLI